MDRSSFLARLIGPTFVAIALGMLINLSIYERMIAEALRPGILLYLSGLLSLLAGLAIINLHMAHGLARDHYCAWLADDDWWHNPHRRAAGHDRDWFDCL